MCGAQQSHPQPNTEKRVLPGKRVLPVVTIGALPNGHIVIPTTVGSKNSTKEALPSHIKWTSTTCVQCVRFNCLSIDLLVYKPPEAGRTQDNYFLRS